MIWPWGLRASSRAALQRWDSNPRVLIVAPLYPPAFRGGGPIRTLAALVQDPPGHMHVRVLTSDRDLQSKDRLPVPRNHWTDEAPPRTTWYASTDSPTALLKALRAAAAWRPNLVYCNSYFNPLLSISVRVWFRWRSTQVLIAPRGEFSEAALSIKRRKKRLFLAVARLIRLDSSAIWHASSNQEALDVRKVIGEDACVVIRENDSLLPTASDRPTHVGSPPRLAFVSRLVENKGLHVLLEALGRVKHPFSLDVYGPEEDERYVHRCRELVSSLGLENSVHFHGPIENDHVRAVFARHDLFPYPTSTENFGHAIAESLSVGCAVMIADTTPWTARLREGGGVVVDGLEVEAWVRSLDAYLQGTRVQRLRLRHDAATTFDRWRSAATPHVLSLVEAQIATD